MRPLAAGTLRHRIQLQRQIEVVDEATKAPKRIWQDFGDFCWGSVEPLSGRELLVAQQVIASVTHRVRLRYQEGVTPDMRVKFYDTTLRYLSITQIIDQENRHYSLELLCEEVKL